MTRTSRPILFIILLSLLGLVCLRDFKSAATGASGSQSREVALAPVIGAALADTDEEPVDFSPLAFAEKKAERRAQRAWARAQANEPPADTLAMIQDEGGVPREYAIALDEVFIPSEGAVRSVPPARGLAEHLGRLQTPEPGAAEDWRRSAAPRLVLYPRSGPRTRATLRIVTPGVALTLSSPSAPLPAARPDLGIVAWERPGYAPDQAIARVVGDAAQPLRALRALAESAASASARPLLARAHLSTAVPAANLFSRQWHLRNTGQGGATPGIDVRAVPAWNLATGLGVTIGVVDGAFERYHPALSQTYDLDLAQDWIDGDEHPWTSYTQSDQTHATAVAGLAVAPGFGQAGADAGTPPTSRVSGTAPHARLAPLRLIGGYTTEEDDAEAMIWEPERIAVKNNSWGPYPFTDRLYPLPPLFRAALASAVAEGRGGLGTIFVWGAGNGRAEGFQGPKNAYAANRQAIAVASIDRNGASSYFSDGGPHILVSAPGNGAGKGAVALTTTDCLGLKGYNGKYITRSDLADQDYTNSFRGTSASAPLVSGVAALLLDLRPDLGWRDVQEILMRSATELRSSEKTWTRRAASSGGFRIKHHPRLGAGLVNAERALRLAQDWTPLPAEQQVVGTLNINGSTRIIPDGSRDFTDYPFDLDSSTPLRVEHVELTLDIRHAYRGDLTIQLVSPDGVVSEFATRTYDDDASDYPAYTFSSVRHWGENSFGGGAVRRPWKLRIKDDVYGDEGYLLSARLHLYGVPVAAPTVTRELADTHASAGNPLVLSFAASGTDLTYLWYRNGKQVRETTGPVYFVAKPTKAELAASYRCVVKNSLGSVSTATVRAMVDEAPTISLHGYSSLTLDYTPENPFPTPAKWSLENIYGYSIDSRTGRITGHTSEYTNRSGHLVARHGDRVVRRPIGFAFSREPDSSTQVFRGFVTQDLASGESVALNAWLWAINGGDLTFNGFDAQGQPLSIAVRNLEGYTKGDGLLRLRSSQGTGMDGIAIGGNRDVFSSDVRVGEQVFPITFRRSLTYAYADEALAAAYRGNHVFSLTPVTADPRLPAGTSLGTISLGSWILPSFSLHLADGSTLAGEQSLSFGGYVFVNATLDTATHRNRIIGWLKLPVSSSGDPALQGRLHWSRASLSEPENFDAPGCFTGIPMKVEGGRVPAGVN